MQGNALQIAITVTDFHYIHVTVSVRVRRFQATELLDRALKLVRGDENCFIRRSAGDDISRICYLECFAIQHGIHVTFDGGCGDVLIAFFVCYYRSYVLAIPVSGNTQSVGHHERGQTILNHATEVAVGYGALLTVVRSIHVILDFGDTSNLNHGVFVSSQVHVESLGILTDMILAFTDCIKHVQHLVSFH